MDHEFAHIESWHRLLDALCDRHGFTDSMTLAARYCELTSGRGQKHFDTAVRNLNNWRSGRHLPRPRSMRILTRLLEVEADPVLLSQWNRLYDVARKTPQGATTEGSEDQEVRSPVPARAPAFHWAILALAGMGLFSMGLGTGLVWNSDWRPWRTAVDDAPLITYLPEVRLVVGQSRIIHGERGDCGKLPRDWRDVWGNLPTSRIGQFSDAGIVRRYSMFCKGVTPARGVLFTATAAGTEEMYVVGDYMKITVVDPADLSGGAADTGATEP